MATIRLPGREQTKTQLDLQLPNQTTASVAVSAHRSMTKVPTEVVSLFTQGLQYANEDDPAWNLRLISLRSTSFRAAGREGSLSAPDAIIATAMELGQNFVFQSRTLPPPYGSSRSFFGISRFVVGL